MTIDDDQAKYYSPPLDIRHLPGLFLPRTTNDIFNTGVHCLYILERVPALSTHSSYLILHAIVAGLYLAFIKLPAVSTATWYSATVLHLYTCYFSYAALTRASFGAKK